MELGTTQLEMTIMIHSDGITSCDIVQQMQNLQSPTFKLQQSALPWEIT